MMKLVETNRRELEKKVIRAVISPNSTEQELDDALQSLKPAGKLKIVTQTPERPCNESE